MGQGAGEEQAGSVLPAALSPWTPTAACTIARREPPRSIWPPSEGPPKVARSLQPAPFPCREPQNRSQAAAKSGDSGLSPSRVYHPGVNSRELLIFGVVTISNHSTTELIPGN